MSISRGSACLLWVWHLLVAPGEDEHLAVGVHGHRRTAQQLAALTQGGGGISMSLKTMILQDLNLSTVEVCQ